MKFVISLAFGDPTHILELARGADECGFHSIAISDHVVHPEVIQSPYPYTNDGEPRWEAAAPWPDPWVTIAAMAAVTTRLRFFTSIFVLPLRSPFAVAKAVGTAQVLSGGRVALGIGVGWMKDEFLLMEQDFHTRGRRTDEMIEVMRTLWRGGMVEHHGEFYDFDRLQMSPAPTDAIPLYFGGLSDAALRRVGRVGDGWISDLHRSDEIRDLIGRVRQHRAEAGRGDAPLDVIASVSDVTDADGYRRLGDAGVTHINTIPWIFYQGATESLQEKLDGMRQFADDVIARMP